jgi:hypothetical protein
MQRAVLPGFSLTGTHISVVRGLSSMSAIIRVNFFIGTAKVRVSGQAHLPSGAEGLVAELPRCFNGPSAISTG